MSDLYAVFTEAAHTCEAMGSPLTGQVVRLAADLIQPGAPLSDKMLSWPGDMRGTGDNLPIRLAGGLHALVLSGAAPELAQHYPPNAPGKGLSQAIAAALVDHADFLTRWIDNHPQTNEIARAAVLIATGAHLDARYGLPIRLSELGASAGLNLRWDQFALELPDQQLGPADALVRLRPNWNGPLPPNRAPTVTERMGVDLSPRSPDSPDDILRLRAYVWADQVNRMARLQAGLATAAKVPAEITQGDAIDWLEVRLKAPVPGTLHLIYHTVAWQYFPEASKKRGTALIEAAGAKVTPEAPLAWLSMEADGQSPGAGLTLRLWPGNATINLGRADFHGRWVDWAPAEL